MHHADPSTPRDATPSDSDQLLTELARSIRELDRVTGLDLAFEVGQLLVDHLYGGDRARIGVGGPEDELLARLSRHPELGLGRRGLGRVAAVYGMIVELGGPDACKHVGADHIRAVLALSGPGRRELLELAEGHRWSVTELEHAVRVMAARPARSPEAPAQPHPSGPGRGVRPSQPAFSPVPASP
ncbi:MAG: hypothetical protein JRI23_12055 [Deltaproteobacteria bacterium]|jgi:hypothetical protein|nr:hypothetical protein [Deltaproteobacteria bacterium]MBW2532442.1 hypothetical protein [Deltaproteobacteria bacterium]